MTIEQAKDLVTQFEECSLPKERWTHEAHFVMALWYCSHQPVPVALQSIRNGIKKYNVSVGGANTDDAGYHETITVFYTRIIINYLLKSNTTTVFRHKLAGLFQQPFMAKDFPLQYYSKDRLMSKKARKEWIPPDIQSLQ
jgi:hypothetical protein